MTRSDSTPVPPVFLERMRSLLGDEFPAFLTSYDAQPATGLRINTLKITPDSFQKIAPFDLNPLAWCPAGFTITSSVDAVPGKHPYHAAGLYYLQDPSAMAPAELLDPQPGERVLDLAAAPGGKATHLAALMGGQGLLVANEIHPKRAWDLAENLERWGARNVAITAETPERLAEHFGGFFDAVLVDAPCSGEGMLRRGEAARREWAPELVRGCALRQAGILAHAARLVRPGGRLVYATCTFAPEEDEGSVAEFLAAHPEFELLDPPRQPGFSPGRPDWLPGERSRAELTRCVRLWPHTGPGEGHFMALLRRSSAQSSGAAPAPWRPARLAKGVEAAYRTFCAEALNDRPAGERLALVGSYLYALPDDLPELAGLRYLHPGWWLGAIRGERLAPSHALALGLRPQAARRVLDLPPDGQQVGVYLRGETLTSPGEEGWTLVTVAGYPLGWGKRVGGRLKSHYPRGLRQP